MATKQSIITEITADLGANYTSADATVLGNIVDDAIDSALRVSNRINKTNQEEQLDILKSNIKKAVKTIYLQRGVEDVSSNSEAGLSNTYTNAIDIMTSDIIRENKRLLY